MTDQAREAVQLLLKNRQSDNRQSYLVRGRRYEQLSADDLSRLWAEQMSRWADDSTAFDQRALNDLGVEMGLRQMAPPLEQIAAAREKILAKSGKALAAIFAGYPETK
ncbi:MAG: hypothetical protein ACOY3N_14020 [Bradyrhizobium sp.]|jgi:hypothetical protein|uniref:hypothetical protein n=1 Tax=Bradyrhizobium TaxID=374 RepID=UPI000462A646|nr:MULTISPECIES: hypothetical protein [Bradyrhizobium]KQT02971.1 hypothetical protein ASG57_15395 [Bradyrhizobium sp. Leaf396]